MTADVTELRPGLLGDGAKIDPDGMLEANKGLFRTLVMIGVSHDGILIVAGSEGAAESAFLMAQGQAFLVHNEVARDG